MMLSLALFSALITIIAYVRFIIQYRFYANCCLINTHNAGIFAVLVLAYYGFFYFILDGGIFNFLIFNISTDPGLSISLNSAEYYIYSLILYAAFFLFSIMAATDYFTFRISRNIALFFLLFGFIFYCLKLYNGIYGASILELFLIITVLLFLGVASVILAMRRGELVIGNGDFYILCGLFLFTGLFLGVQILFIASVLSLVYIFFRKFLNPQLRLKNIKLAFISFLYLSSIFTCFLLVRWQDRFLGFLF